MAFEPLAFSSSPRLRHVKEILDPYSNYSAFTKYLTDLKLVDMINSRPIITILVVDNTTIAPISPRWQDQNCYLRPHSPRLLRPLHLRPKPQPVCPLPHLVDGSMNVTELPSEHMVLWWAVLDTPLNSNLINVIGASLFNLSVLQICQYSKSVQPVGAQSLIPFNSRRSRVDLLADRYDVCVSLAKVEEAYKHEKQTKAAISEAVQLLSLNDLTYGMEAADEETDENRVLPAMNIIWPYLILCLKNKVSVV
ncbi:hypothetical protein B296_00032856 [Ensete ventricosum]|uniref:Uncharacterized protein n=1 Tax=Ensete ventricosum TaxID=4639 RepID=A0A426ZNP7_ENSVE|nr:hypothetical protein B296_00032856 [Ensete ventricosum]